MPLPQTNVQPWVRHKLRVIYFGDASWGFSDAAIPKLRALFEKSDLPVDIWHNGLTVDFSGEVKTAEFDRVRALLEKLRTTAEFERCTIGVAEGEVECAADVSRVTAKAIANGRTG